MISRREWLEMTLGASIGVTLGGCARPRPGTVEAPQQGQAQQGQAQQGQLIRRAIPSSGEMLPVVGLGTSATFQTVARGELTALKEVMKTMVEHGATVFDTAPSYGASEQVGGDIANELGLASKIFWATKVNVAGGRGGGATADPARARAQIDASFAKFKVPKIDLIQVHNLGDVPTQLGILKELKKEGRVRYIGVTTTSNNAYGRLEEVMRNEPLDFIGIDYAVDERNVETTILPLARERKIGVLVYVPFGRNRLWNRVAGKEVPAWAKDFDATTWAQFFIKYVVAHPAVTAVTPATSQAKHMIDNIGGGIGLLPDEATRKRMAEFVDALPPAGN